MPLPYLWLGRRPYAEVARLQEELRDRILAGDDGAQTLLFVEHDPVLTLGRSAGTGNVLAPADELAARGVELVRSTRGGDVTAHGPGQLVIYPVVRLPRGVLAFVEAVGGAIAGELRALGVAAAEWRRQPAGVWVGDDKIAACGLHIRRRVAMHGFALNVTSASLALFELIVPCGLAGVHATSIESAIGRAPPLEELARALAERITRALDAKILP